MIRNRPRMRKFSGGIVRWLGLGDLTNIPSQAELDAYMKPLAAEFENAPTD